MNTGRPPSVETLKRHLVAAQTELRWELRMPHPHKGQHARRLRTWAHRITVLMARIKDLEAKTKE